MASTIKIRDFYNRVIGTIEEDSQGNKYMCPKDFTYSKFVNRMRQFGRNMSKLDRPILQTLKWALIIGAGALVIFLLKHFGII